MSRDSSPGLLDRIEDSRFGEWVIRPVVAVCFYAMAGIAFVIAIVAFWVAFQQAQRSVDQATNAASAAVAKSNQTQAQQESAQRRQGEFTRLAICNIVHIYSNAYTKLTSPPTPTQQAVFGAWQKLGDTPILHCDK